MNEKFELVLKPYRQTKTYRMQVEVILRTPQQVRFTISGGEKLITMEKLLYKKTGSWKIVETNFNINDSSAEQTAYTIFELQNLLDAWLAKDTKPPLENPKYEH